MELELISNPQEALVGGDNSSSDFTINNVQLKCDLITLDSDLDNEYANRLLSGKPIPVPYCTFTCSQQVITSMDVNLNIQRSFTRLKGVFISLWKDKGGGPGSESVSFWNPAGDDGRGNFPGRTDYQKALQVQMQIGSKLYPEYPMASMPERFYQLKKMLNKQMGEGSMDLKYEQYRKDKFIMAIDTEK